MNGNRYSRHLTNLGSEYEEDSKSLQYDLYKSATNIRPNFIHIRNRLSTGGWEYEDLEVIKEIIDSKEIPTWSYVRKEKGKKSSILIDSKVFFFIDKDDFPIDDDEIERIEVPSSYSMWLMIMGEIGWLDKEVVETESLLWDSHLVRGAADAVAPATEGKLPCDKSIH